VSSAAVMSRMKIIDMTGREHKVLHSLQGLATADRRHFDLPELTKNLELLVDMTEQKIIHSEKKLKHFDDTLVSLEYEEARGRERACAEQAQVERVEALLGVVERCQALLESGSDLKAIMAAFTEIKSDFPDEFLVFSLHQLAIPLFGPVLSRKMSAWRPFDPDHALSDLLYCYDLFADLRDLFKDLQGVSVSPFHRLLWDSWMTAVRKQLHEHGIRACTDRCVDLLGRWSRLVPRFMVENVLEKLVLVKLVCECEAWNPLVDVVPIHSWVHPWLPLLKERMDSELFPLIRNKLAYALTAWHPSDGKQSDWSF
jgi:tuftelin-interacting protein 11